MIYLLHGEDSFRSKRKLDEIVKEYQGQKTGFNLVFMDSLDGLQDKVKQISIFKENRLIVLRNVFSDRFLAMVKDLTRSEDIIIVYEDSAVKKADVKSIKNVQEFKRLSPVQMLEWIKQEFQRFNCSFDADVPQLLFSRTGNDSWGIANEIMKLANYKKKITSVDVKLLVRAKIELAIFKTIDAIALKDKKHALNLLTLHIGEGDSPFQLLSMIAYQFRNLLMVKELVLKNNDYSAIVKKTKLNPFVARKNYYQCQKFQLKDLKKIYQDIFRADSAFKTGKLDPEMGLELLLSSIN